LNLEKFKRAVVGRADEQMMVLLDVKLPGSQRRGNWSCLAYLQIVAAKNRVRPWPWLESAEAIDDLCC